MLEYRTLPFLIGAVLLVVAVASDDSINRKKRQAPNINVHQIPKTSFSCVDRKIGEYYADPEANCQVYHVCIPGMHNKMSLISFVCPNGTIFSQATRVCTPYERVDCSLTTKFYDSLHGSAVNKRPNYEADGDFENYVPQPPPREPAQPARQSTRSRNTPAPPPPPPREIPVQPARNNRFRSGANQFRAQQAPPATTPAPRTTTAAPVPASVPVRNAVRPALPAFRPPVLGARPSQLGAVSNVLPARPTPRAVVSTSTSNYNYEYEYEYDYEDETPATDQANTRSKREVGSSEDYDSENFESKFRTSFNCEDKVAGGVYADVESDCEMFHICVPLGKYKMLDYKVFCANNTGFDQETGSCREKTEFICENAYLFYQFEKPHQPTSSKKPVLSKKKYTKSKKASSVSKEY